MKNNFDDQLTCDESDYFEFKSIEDKDKWIAWMNAKLIPILEKQIKAEISAQMPKEVKELTDMGEPYPHRARMSKVDGYNQALQEVTEALQLEGKKE